MSSSRVIVVPRWGARPDDDWYPWITAELAGSPTFAPVVVADMPAPEAPVIAAWAAHLAALAGAERATLARTVLVGHSVGCQAILHFLSSLPAPLHVKGVLCVAGWWQVDDPWERILPWLEGPPNLARVRAGCGFVGVLLSDDDPFTADAAANRRLWEARLGATVEVVPGAEHFNHEREPQVLSALHRWFAA